MTVETDLVGETGNPYFLPETYFYKYYINAYDFREKSVNF